MASLFNRQALAPTLSLFMSSGTLLCCALPAALVTLGMGSVMAGLVSTFPGLIWMTERKEWLFGMAGVMLVIAWYFRWRSRNDPCPIDPEEARACTRMRRIGAFTFWVSVILYLIGFFFAFLAADIFFPE